MLRIGLTGGIGSGKSAVAALFAELGAPVLDADRIARELVEPGQPALEEIVSRLGADILKEGCLDRGRLRRIAFDAPTTRRWLESLLHPRVYSEMTRRMEGCAAPYCVLVIPLLLETGQRGFVDRLLVVDCPVDEQRRRVMLRDGSGADQVERILAAQLSRQERLAAADDIIENTGTLLELKGAVERLHRRYAESGQRSLAAPAPEHSRY